MFIGADQRLRSGWRFALGVCVIVVVNFAAPNIAAAFHPGTFAAFEAIYRPLIVIFECLGLVSLLLIFDHSEQPLADMGLGFSRPWLRESVAGFLMGSTMVIIAILAIAGIGSYHAQPLNSRFPWQSVVAQIWILSTAAMSEELAFRGYPFQRLLQAVQRPWIAILVLSILFGTIHLKNPAATVSGFTITILIGVLLALAYVRTGSLWLAWGIHFGWNFCLGVIFGLPVSGLDEFSVWRKGVVGGPLWLTGGDYGLEASFTGCVIILLACIVLWKLTASGDSSTAS